jgi:UMF1 family MFS transporter
MDANQKQRIGWYFYDWANSAFYTTVISVFLGPYLTYITGNAADSSGFVYVLGLSIYAHSFFSYCVSFSVLLQVLILPIIGSFADYTGSKKLLLGMFTYTGAIATMCFYFLDGSNFIFGGVLLIVANLSFGGAVIIYNSFLNDIASRSERDSVSSIGWAAGYLGGGILLALNLILFANTESLGISSNYAIRISLCSAGVWWALFSLFTMVGLKSKRNINVIKLEKEDIIVSSFKQLKETIIKTRENPRAMRFLIAYLLYNDGVQTVIVIATQFGANQLNLSQSFLIQVILIVQFVAFLGAILFNFISKKTGNKKAILFSLIVWSGCVIYSYLLLDSATGFLVLAVVIALVLGGTQALSRSLFSLLIPENKEAEYFSIYEISERGTSWIGPLLFGLALQFTGSYRIGILSLIIFFVAGFAVLYKLKIQN